MGRRVKETTPYRRRIAILLVAHVLATRPESLNHERSERTRPLEFRMRRRRKMQFPDLHEFPKGHPPSPYGKPLLVVKVGDGVLPEDLTLRAVGWLERPGFPTGSVSKEIIDALVAALRGGIFSDGYRGIHMCTLCSDAFPAPKWRRRTIALKGHGHYLLLHERIVYMAPALLLHYILGHQYRPPDEFLEAVAHGRFLTENDLAVNWRAPGELGPA
jgi:hypothetical protein